MLAVPPPDDVVARLRSAGCVFAEDEARLLRAEATDDAVLARLVARRVSGEPLEQVLGWAELCGHRVRVEPGVFVPRRRTALLAHEAVRRARSAAARRGARAVVVDLCCGSGAIAVVVHAEVAGVDLHAADADPVACACARRNLPASVPVHMGDLYTALPGPLAGRIDVVVANAPYVPTSQIRFLAPEARLHEPMPTLDGGPDGLDVVRRVVAGAPHWLAPGGSVLVETGESQRRAVLDVVATAGLVPSWVADTDVGATVVAGTRADG